MTGPVPDAAPRIPLDLAPGPTSAADLETAVSSALAHGGASFLMRQRWFGDKARTIRDIALDDLAFATLTAPEPERIMLAVIRVRFTSGDDAGYFLPLTLSEQSTHPGRILAVFETPAGQLLLRDAADQAAFHAWLLSGLLGDGPIVGGQGSFTWSTSPASHERIAAARLEQPRLSSAEQSNSAVIYGQQLLVKIFRKLRSGANPDIEISRFLTQQTDFTHFPTLLADLSYRSPDGEPYAMAMALPFVPNVGDAWAFFQSRLQDMIDGTAVELDTIGPMRRLGRRTGQLHAALAVPTLDAAFAPEPITTSDRDRWSQDLDRALATTLTSLQAHADRLPAHLQDLIASLTSASEQFTATRSGFTDLVGVDKIRVHGDYHLGQVLVTPDEDFVILDFEGEPSRTIEERQAKTSPLKDVAGMLRSIAYARAAASFALPNDAARAASGEMLATWEHDARDAFLAGYREETFDKAVSFLPADQTGFDAAQAAWELDKALYEIAYELNNRPDWLPIPLGALLRS